MADVKAARFLVSGKVQGVWFRASTRAQAERLALRGHARNLVDGSGGSDSSSSAAESAGSGSVAAVSAKPDSKPEAKTETKVDKPAAPAPSTPAS